jgi:hypothetical protein
MKEENLKKEEKGCVYFFRHIGLSPVKIGYSMSESPLNRFNQFKTYAPFGSEILGFIITDEAKKIESELHNKLSPFRLKGEWFEITEEEVNNHINFYTNIEDIKRRNDFQIEWSKKIFKENEEVKNEVLNYLTTSKAREKQKFMSKYKLNKNINRSRIAKDLGVSRQTIITWIKEIENNF